jgi:flagellar capping protein FliD
MATSSSAFFTGTSAFSADFQNVIQREVQLASQPIAQLQTDQTTLNGQSTELNTLSSKFSALQNAIQGIDQAVSGSSFETNIDNPSVVAATVGNGAMEGNYSIQVQDIGAYATSLTASSWVDTSGPAQTYQLVIGGQTYNITPADNSATSVAAAINSQEGDKVEATVVNVGSSSAPDYRISLQNNTLGDSPVDLQLNGTSLQTQQTTGRPAQYIVNNSGNTVISNSRTVTIANGLTLNLLSSSAAPVNITLTRSTSALSNALQNFAAAYNAAVDEVGSQHGQSGGALEGSAVILDLSQALGQIGTYSSPGSAVSSLADLGLTLGSDGHLTYSPATLLGADLLNSSAVNAFLGSVSGGGFLAAAASTVTGVADPATGELTSAELSIQTQLQRISASISSKQDQVNQLQAQLTAQMAAADAAIASMEQQYTYLSGMFQAMQTADLQYARG